MRVAHEAFAPVEVYEGWERISLSRDLSQRHRGDEIGKSVLRYWAIVRPGIVGLVCWEFQAGNFAELFRDETGPASQEPPFQYPFIFCVIGAFCEGHRKFVGAL